MRIENILDQGGVQYFNEGGHHHARSGWLQMDCPHCSPGWSKYRLGYNLKGNYFNCWVCGRVQLGKTLRALTGLSYDVLKPLVKEIQTREQEVWEGFDGTATGKLVLPYGVGDLQKQHRTYLRRRGFDPAHLAEVWGLQGIGISPTHPWRIFIPIKYRGETVSWTTRTIKGSPKDKYLAAEPDQERISRKFLLFGEDYCTSYIIIHEGPFDAMRTGPGAVALMSLSYNAEQRTRLKDYPLRIVCFDNEPDAQRRAEVLCDWLSVYPGKTLNVQLDANDPASASDREIATLRRLTI